jgi:predicted DCC family thiol-disulfide oxidoreductase YuxK
MIDKVPVIVIYDGRCGLCHRAVRHILKWDHYNRFQFAANESEPGKSLLKHSGIPFDPPPETIVVIADNKTFTESDAALIIAQNLGGIHWPLVVGWVVPKFMRDWFYKRIARNRYRIFGQLAECRLPSQAEVSKFLDNKKERMKESIE